MRWRARHYQTGELVDVVHDGGTIRSVGPAGDGRPDACAGWVAPAFFDLQVNGAGGVGFHRGDLRVEEIGGVVRACRAHGTGGFCPTVITNDFASQCRALAAVRRAREQDADAAGAIPAVHLEGPYISPEDGPRGAHPRRHVRPPDWDEFRRFQEAAGGLIRLVTLAPEHDGALAFVERLRRAGVVVALGHTAADARRIRDAVAAGARLSTHLGNGCHAYLPRHENCLWEQLAADELWASIICDGHHLPASVVRCIIRVKTPARTILTSDAGSLAGLPPGPYRDWEQDLEVTAEGKIVLAGTPFLAGSWAFLDAGVANAVAFAGLSLGEAVDMAGARPRELLGLPPRPLAPGAPADLILFDWQPEAPLEIRVGGPVTAA